MGEVITYHFNDDFIAELAGYIARHYAKDAKGLESLSVVFGGKRPALFLKKELSRTLGGGFFPPRIFSIDDFIRQIVSPETGCRMITELDAYYLIYQAALESASEILAGRESFAQFLPWAREIAHFIDELDLEDIPDQQLASIEASAAIGYEIPESINRLLSHITVLRREYHRRLAQRGEFSRGLLYLSASRNIAGKSAVGFGKVLFCNFYYLYKTETAVIRHFYDNAQATLFFQKDETSWPAFEQLSKDFSAVIEPPRTPVRLRDEKIYKGFDRHSQVGLVREALKTELASKDGDLSRTLVLLSDPDSLIPLLSEISSLVEDCNVSMGYPLARSSLFALFNYIAQAQATRKGALYYTKDYLKVLMHPLMKNMLFEGDPAISRVLCHKVEEALLGAVKSPLSGALFLSLTEIEAAEQIYLLSAETLSHLELTASPVQLKKLLSELHAMVFRRWEHIASFADFAESLSGFTKALLEKSLIGNYPLDTKILERVLGIQDELTEAEFKDQSFDQREIFQIFRSRLEEEKVAFSGSPLKGLQVLELLETRSLSFASVFVMDANESLLPKVKVYEPLIPRQVMEALGLKRLQQEEDIQRYHFMRLIGSASKVCFIYDDNQEKEKSRFLEQVIWEKQKKTASFKALPQVRGRFSLGGIRHDTPVVRKDKKVADFLKEEFVHSASSIDTYLHCPFAFYFQYVLRLKEKEDLLDAPEARDIGDFIHGLFDHAFRQFLGEKPVIEGAFMERFWDDFNRRFDQSLCKRLGSEAFMVKDVMRYRLERFLERERRRPVKKIVSLEEERQDVLAAGTVSARFKYRIDRIDELDDQSLLIIDYKSGTSAIAPTGLAGLEKMPLLRSAIKETMHSFQLPLYYYGVRKRYPKAALNAALYSVGDGALSEFIRPKDKQKSDRVEEICLKALEALIGEMTDPEKDFVADASNSRYCAYCPFTYICR